MHALFSGDTRHTAGVLLLTILGIEYGGLYVLKLVRGSARPPICSCGSPGPGTPDAGVLVILSLIALPYADVVHLSATGVRIAATASWIAAILMPLGFFVSVAGRDVRRPNKFIASTDVGAVSLGAGVLHPRHRPAPVVAGATAADEPDQLPPPAAPGHAHRRIRRWDDLVRGRQAT